MAATSDVRVLGAWPSPFVNRVVIALKLKSIEFEMIEINPHEKGEILVMNNPVYKKIPILIHAGRPVCESLNIVEYIDDAWPYGPFILPRDPYDRSIARFWAAYMDEKWFPLFGPLREAQDETEREAIKEKISEGLDLLEEAFIKCSKGKRFFGGDNVGFLDIALGSHVGWLRVTEMLVGTTLLDERKNPRLIEWVERIYSDSPVKDAMLDAQKLLEVFKRFMLIKQTAVSS